MRIENIDARGIMAENGLFAAEGNQSVKEDRRSIIDDETKILKSQRVDLAGYDRGMLKGAGSMQEAADLMSAESERSAMEKMLKTLGSKGYEELEKNDYSPEAMEERRITTVVEKMQLEMAKAGVDISKTASDLDAKDIEAITGSAQAASSIETAMAKALEIEKSGELTEGETDYLLSNELEPTIDNIYAAKFSGANAKDHSSGDRGPDGRFSGTSSQGAAGEAAQAGFEAIKSDAENIIKKAGLDVNQDTLDEARYLYENGLPVTAENVKLIDKIYNDDLITSSNPPDSDVNPVAGAIIDAALEGRAPGEAYLLPRYSVMDRARDFKDFVDNASSEQIAKRDDIDDITARRILEETRLAMTVEANFSLMKRGIAIDTQPLAQVVEELKNLEKEYYSAASGMENVSSDDAAAFKDTCSAVDMLKQSPAYALGQMDIKTATLEEAKNVGWDLKDRFDRANETYEALGTSPRADLGDSIKKAFRNVDDILKDLGMAQTNENRRAVRILGYNNLEINENSVLEMREADETVQRTFKNLTPGVVAQMVKSGIDPLDMTMDELNTKAEEIKSTNNIDNDSDRFSRFLVKLEQNKEITEEERSAYIGIYRLISRVEATDGAAIGSLLHQDRELTMRNLMTAVRTGKKAARGFEEAVDDERGYKEIKREELTITEQIEQNIASFQLRSAGEIMTPAMIKEASRAMMVDMGEDVVPYDTVLDMTPAELLSALEKSAGEEVVEREAAEYSDLQLSEMRRAADSSDEVYDLLKNLSLPATTENLQAASYFMTGRNKLFSDLISEAERQAAFLADSVAKEKSDASTIRALIEKCVQELGEDVKTPQEMAEAQEALAELAEHAMDGYMTEEEVSSVDIKGMKLTRTVAHFLKEMARTDSYNLPIKVNDAVGNISVKIVHGEEKKGLAEFSFFCRELGDVKGSLHYTPDAIEYELTAENDDVRGLIENRTQELDDILAGETGQKRAQSAQDGPGNGQPLAEDAITDNDIMRAAGRILDFLKNLAGEV